MSRLKKAKPRIAFDVNFFIDRWQCKHGSLKPAEFCKNIEKWEDLIMSGEVEAVIPQAVEDILVMQNLKKGRGDIMAGLRGIPISVVRFKTPTESWMKELSSEDVVRCMKKKTTTKNEKRISECMRRIDREDMTIYSQASKIESDYIVTGDNAWLECQDFFKTMCDCIKKEEDEVVCGIKQPKIISVREPWRLQLLRK